MKQLFVIFLTSVTVIFSQTSIIDLNRELDSLKSEYLDELDLEEETSIDSDIISPESIELESPPTVAEESLYFGYNYFKRDINFFDNIPTPSDYKLGPGDEVVLSLWGEHNLRDTFIINKDGMIYYENLGFINISNKTINEAEITLTKELSKIYETLNNKENPTNLMLELGKLKSINVYFSGQIENPGVNLIHPFSDIFSALVQAGGIKDEGSLRAIQLIRKNKIIDSIDFYSFFINGKNNFSNVKIIDGDIIHVPTVTNRIQIEGEIITSGYFELLENESIADLVNYAGGLSANASSFAILDMIIPISDRLSDDNARKTKNIHLKEFLSTNVNNGDSINILSIGDVETRVEVLGRVKFPGEYAPSSLKNVLDIAGGFNDPLYRKTIRDNEIIVLRKDEKQFYALEFKVHYKESDSFELISGDKIFVYENNKYNNLFSISVIGEVNKRGSFKLKPGMTVKDAIDLGEGFTPLGNENGIIVTEVFTSTDDIGNQIEQSTKVSDANLDFVLTDGSVVNVLPLENVVSIEGNVYNPGLVTYTKGKTVNKYINLAGGPRPNTLSSRIYVKRANGRIKKITFFQGIGTIVRPGDTIFVPLDPDPQEFDITAFVADLAATLANIAAILLVIDNND